MTRNLIILFFLLLLTNCGISGSAFLGPAYTGVKTGSVYQTSLSYSSGKIVNQLKENDLIKKSKNIDTFLKKNPSLPDIPYVDKDPLILLTYKVDTIDIFDVSEIEHLP